MTHFGDALRSVVALYGGTRSVARRLDVAPWTLRRWYLKPSANTLTVGTLSRLCDAMPELAHLLSKETTH